MSVAQEAIKLTFGPLSFRALIRQRALVFRAVERRPEKPENRAGGDVGVEFRERRPFAQPAATALVEFATVDIAIACVVNRSRIEVHRHLRYEELEREPEENGRAAPHVAVWAHF